MRHTAGMIDFDFARYVNERRGEVVHRAYTGATYAFANGFSLAAAYTDTNADDALYTNPFGTEVADATVALTLTKAF